MSFTDRARLHGSSISVPRVLRTRRQRGAAFVESLIVISLILFVLFCILWLQALYSAKLATLQSARTNAWLDALEGCTGFEQANEILGDSVVRSRGEGATGAADDTSGSIGGITADTQGESPDWFNLREGGNASESVEFNAIMTAGRTFDVTTSRTVMCNERSNPEELELNAGDLFSNIASIVRDLFD